MLKKNNKLLLLTVLGTSLSLILVLITLIYTNTQQNNKTVDQSSKPININGSSLEKESLLYKEGNNTTDILSNNGRLTTENSNTSTQGVEQANYSNAAPNPYSQYVKENSDFVGFITIDDTNIDYPIVKGQDNDYYLNKNFDRQKDKYGSIFMDYRNFGIGFDQHTIIYGHNMKDHQMFGDLKNYLDIDFLTSHPVIEINGLFGTKYYRVFSVYYMSADPTVIQTAFRGSEFSDFITTISKRSLFPLDIKPQDSDNLLTLITCSYDIDNGRYVVHAVETASK